MSGKSKKKRGRKRSSNGIDWSEDWRPVGRALGLVAVVLGTLALGAIMAVDDEGEIVAEVVPIDPRPEPLAERLPEPEPERPTELPRSEETHPLPDSVAAEAEPEIDEPEPIREPEAAPEAAPRRDRPSRVVADTPPPAVEAPTGGPVARIRARAANDLARIDATDGWTLQLVYACDAGNVERLIAPVASRSELHILPYNDCWRVTWGRYASRLDAEEGTTGLPDSLGSQVGDSAIPKELRSLVR